MFNLAFAQNILGQTPTPHETQNMQPESGCVMLPEITSGLHTVNVNYLSWSALRNRGKIICLKLLVRSSLGWLLALLMDPFNLRLRKLWRFNKVKTDIKHSSEEKNTAQTHKYNCHLQAHKCMYGIFTVSIPIYESVNSHSSIKLFLLP